MLYRAGQRPSRSCACWRSPPTRRARHGPSASRSSSAATWWRPRRAPAAALPVTEIASYACALPLALAEPLRQGEPAVVGIVRDDRLLLDCRTLTDAEVEEVAAAVRTARG